jgi:trans-2,3-dihydro-3-hydroxyanthranilate isomerase
MRHCYVLRVFTRGGSGGNHLGVVTDVSGLSDRVMAEVAADLGFSETVFVDWRAGGVPRTRIFTPAAELPFAGHPLVGAAWVLNMLGPGGVDAIDCTVGRCAITLTGDRVAITAPGTERPVRRCTIDLAGWVDPNDAMTVSMPIDYHLIEAGSPEAVAEVQPPHLPGEVYLWARNGDVVKARFFAPEMGVVEDPATGSAAVALATVLAARGESHGSLRIHQGDEIGAPSTIHLDWTPAGITIGGTVTRDETRELDV